MPDELVRPFDSIESAQEFMVLLEETIEEALRGVEHDLDRARAGGEERNAQALILALYKMRLLTTHVQKSRRILKDLRALRRLLLKERTVGAGV